MIFESWAYFFFIIVLIKKSGWQPWTGLCQAERRVGGRINISFYQIWQILFLLLICARGPTLKSCAIQVVDGQQHKWTAIFTILFSVSILWRQRSSWNGCLKQKDCWPFFAPWWPFCILQLVERCRQWVSGPFAARLAFLSSSIELL